MVTVEGDDDSWTVDCLRRRLVAERVSSRVAKEDAELMGRKVCFFHVLDLFLEPTLLFML